LSAYVAMLIIICGMWAGEALAKYPASGNEAKLAVNAMASKHHLDPLFVSEHINVLDARRDEKLHRSILYVSPNGKRDHEIEVRCGIIIWGDTCEFHLISPSLKMGEAIVINYNAVILKNDIFSWRVSKIPNVEFYAGAFELAPIRVVLTLSKASSFKIEIRSKFNPAGYPHEVVSFAHRFGSQARILDGLSGKDDLPKQEPRPDSGNPKAALCPKCAIFPSISRAPLSAKVAFSFPLWVFAGGAIFEGLGVGLSRKRRVSLGWIVCGGAIGLIPLFLGI
jgi:hypothetical protein